MTQTKFPVQNILSQGWAYAMSIFRNATTDREMVVPASQISKNGGKLEMYPIRYRAITPFMVVLTDGRRKKSPRLNPILSLLATCALFSGAAFGQFSGNIQGVVKDTAGAAIANGHVTLLSPDTGVSKETDTDASGVYRFVSLAPGPYKITGAAQGFSSTVMTIQLTTGQTLEVSLQLGVQSVQSTVEVTAQAPLLDAADTRNELTIPKGALNTLPLPGHSMLALTTLAPGVTGKGVLSTTPGSATDNFNTETQVDASANGRSGGGNAYIIDGLDVTSGIRPGVLNLTPNPDAIAEASVQVNTFTVDYG